MKRYRVLSDIPLKKMRGRVNKQKSKNKVLASNIIHQQSRSEITNMKQYQNLMKLV